MPKRTDIHAVLVIGSGPIVIGQAAEFDYSGTQACRVLRQEGYRVILVNSNPATIMTDPGMADATYIEPITPEFVERVIAAERPDALLATLGGQTGLNMAVTLHESGVLARYGVELIGVSVEAIERGEDREKFKEAVSSIGEVDGEMVEMARSHICHTIDEIRAAAADLGLPVVLRPSYTMGGLGSGLAHTPEELDRLGRIGLDASPATEVLVEESVLGWKELELEVMRDRTDNTVVVCSIENFDPMGVHTGDSITIAPAMTLTDAQYQRMCDVGLAVVRAVGVDAGGSNLQFAIHPVTGRMLVIEMNPRVSRSSALASKATGFPIAKIAAKLAVGYTLDEIVNDITQVTSASYSPQIDYVVVKAPRFAFEKFPSADATLTTHMKSVGEAMAIGRCFTEAMGKALRSLEDPNAPFDFAGEPGAAADLLARIARPYDGRAQDVMRALRAGASSEQVAAATAIDPWFIDQLAVMCEAARAVGQAAELDAETLRLAKRHGLSDGQIADLRGVTPAQVRARRHEAGVRPVYKRVDTCAARFATTTPYLYSTYDEVTEVAPRERPAVLILGAGPNRIGQGVEFDYSCVHAAMALSEAGYESVMINCNPETVSTDYDTSDRLYFEPLTLEDVLEVYDAECAAGPVAGAFVQLGGQTPLRLAQALKDAGVPILGTSPEAINLAEERGAFGEVLAAAGLPSPKHGMATSVEQARAVAADIGFPVLVRPSYVLGGRGMEIVYDDEALARYIAGATLISPDMPVLVDRFLDDAIELDVDALYDGEELYIGGIMEHIEQAGVHSGDSACSLPSITLGEEVVATLRASALAIAAGVGVRGLINIQYALAGGVCYVLEANPRASRTVPFVAKATDTPLSKAAALVMTGLSIAGLRARGLLRAHGDGADRFGGMPICVKEAVLPFARFHTVEGGVVDALLGPEMRSTGEVMGIDNTFEAAFAKTQIAVYGRWPTSGDAFVSVADRDKRHAIYPLKRLADLGFTLWATAGTAAMLELHGLTVRRVRKVSASGAVDGDDSLPTPTDLINAEAIDLIVNTPSTHPAGGASRADGNQIRSAALAHGVPCITTVQGLEAAVEAITALQRGAMTVRPLQAWAEQMHAPADQD